MISRIEQKVKNKKQWSFLDSSLLVKDCLEKYSCERIESFFDTHFKITNIEEPMNNIVSQVYFVDYELLEEFLKNIDLSQGEHFIIRKSKSVHFQLSATEYRYQDYRIIIYDRIKTAVVMKNKNLIVFISEDSEFAIIELIRDLIIKDQENKGALVLHAAAVTKNNKAFVICGNGGAGKSTTLMEMILKHNYSFMSGDKVFFKLIDGHVLVHGWPDYPNIGVGTIQKYKLLKSVVQDQIATLKATDKILIDFSKFYSIEKFIPYKGILSIGCFIFPDIDIMSNKTEISKINDVKEVFYRNLEFREDYDFRKWQKIVEPDYDRNSSIQKISRYLADIVGYEIRGQLNIPEGVFDERLVTN